MRTAFREIDLDLIRYSVVWEDYKVLEKALRFRGDDNLAMITSAGCNVLNACLSPVKKIYAIDINPIQNLVLEFKIYLILEQDFPCFEDLMGFNGKEKITKRYEAIKDSVPEKFLQLLPQIAEYGMLNCGKLERYIAAFLPAHPHLIEGIQTLVTLRSKKERVDFFNDWPLGGSFKDAFCAWFDAGKLSQGRDPRLFQYSENNTGLAFYQRLVNYLHHREGELPFIFHFFFFGAAGVPARLRPACYTESNFKALKEEVQKIELVTMEAFDYFRSGAYTGLNKYALSNIFEYCSPQEYHDQLSWLFSVAGKGSRFIHWNLLNHQEFPAHYLENESTQRSREEACFYFQNLKLFQI